SMNVVLKKQLSRRTILRGVGTAIALPFLDAMIPAFGAKSKAPTRMAFVYFPNGVQMDSWTPQTEGEIAKLPEALPRVLEPLAPEVRPRAVFERLLGSGEMERDPVRRARLERYRKSVLDSALEDARGLQKGLGATDRRKLDEYLYAIRDIETRVQRTERENAQVPALDKPPSSVPENYNEH